MPTFAIESTKQRSLVQWSLAIGASLCIASVTGVVLAVAINLILRCF